jgi:hypothetical protein
MALEAAEQQPATVELMAGCDHPCHWHHQQRARLAIANQPWCSHRGTTVNLTADHVTPWQLANTRSARSASSADHSTRDAERPGSPR